MGLRIADADVADTRQLVAAASGAERWSGAWLYRIEEDGTAGSRPIRLYRGEGDPRIVQTVGRLTHIQRLDDWGHSTGATS